MFNCSLQSSHFPSESISLCPVAEIKFPFDKRSPQNRQYMSPVYPGVVQDCFRAFLICVSPVCRDESVGSCSVFFAPHCVHSNVLQPWLIQSDGNVTVPES